MMRRSPTRCSTNLMSHSWLTVSKNERMSASSIQFTFVLVIPTKSASIASCVPRPGRNPYENRYLRVLFVQAAWVVLVKVRCWERYEPPDRRERHVLRIGCLQPLNGLLRRLAQTVERLVCPPDVPPSQSARSASWSGWALARRRYQAARSLPAAA